MTSPENSNAPRDERLVVAVVRLGGDRPSQLIGDLVALNGEEATLHLPGGAPFEAGAPVLLVRGRLGSRQVARAAWARAESGSEVFALAAPFEPFDVRSSPRFATRLAVEIRQGATRFEGVMLDISNGGAAVITRERPKGKTLLLGVSHKGFGANLSCQLMGIGGNPGRQMLHLKFDQLNVAEQAFVRQLVRDAEAAADRAQQAAA